MAQPGVQKLNVLLLYSLVHRACPRVYCVQWDGLTGTHTNVTCRVLAVTAQAAPDRAIHRMHLPCPVSPSALLSLVGQHRGEPAARPAISAWSPVGSFPAIPRRKQPSPGTGTAAARRTRARPREPLPSIGPSTSLAPCHAITRSECDAPTAGARGVPWRSTDRARHGVTAH